jgi:hypothetical protein
MPYYPAHWVPLELFAAEKLNRMQGNIAYTRETYSCNIIVSECRERFVYGPGWGSHNADDIRLRILIDDVQVASYSMGVGVPADHEIVEIDISAVTAGDFHVVSWILGVHDDIGWAEDAWTRKATFLLDEDRQVLSAYFSGGRPAGEGYGLLGPIAILLSVQAL